MCKHHWMIEAASKETWEQYEGYPARCKLCGKKKVFRAEDSFGVDYRRRPDPIQPAQLGLAQMPFGPRGGN